MSYQNHIKSIYGPYMGHPRSRNWTLHFEPAFSPRFSPTLSPRSFFSTRQRFPISNHVTSGSMSPRSIFDHWSAVSHTGSSYGHVIALDQSGARKSARWAHFTTFLTIYLPLLILVQFCKTNNNKRIRNKTHKTTGRRV